MQSINSREDPFWAQCLIQLPQSPAPETSPGCKEEVLKVLKKRVILPFKDIKPFSLSFWILGSSLREDSIHIWEQSMELQKRINQQLVNLHGPIIIAQTL